MFSEVTLFEYDVSTILSPIEALFFTRSEPQEDTRVSAKAVHAAV